MMQSVSVLSLDYRISVEWSEQICNYLWVEYIIKADKKK